MSIDAEDFGAKATILRRMERMGGVRPVVDNVVVSRNGHSSSGLDKECLFGSLSREIVNELGSYCGRINPSDKDILSWPLSVAERWKKLNDCKSSNELAVLS